MVRWSTNKMMNTKITEYKLKGLQIRHRIVKFHFDFI